MGPSSRGWCHASLGQLVSGPFWYCGGYLWRDVGSRIGFPYVLNYLLSLSIRIQEEI